MRSMKPDFPAFSRLDQSLVNREWQTHTNWTDGKATIFEMLSAARDRSITDFAFTEHVTSKSTYYQEFKSEVREVAGLFPDIRVLCGVEVKILNASGALDIADELQAMSDLVLASVHSFSTPDGRRIKPGSLSAENAIATEFEMALAFLRRGGADVMSHPGGMSLRAFGFFPKSHFIDLMIACKYSGVAFEINYSYHKYIIDPLLELLARIDPQVSIGSDAHDMSSVGACRDLLRSRLAL